MKDKVINFLDVVAPPSVILPLGAAYVVIMFKRWAKAH